MIWGLEDFLDLETIDPRVVFGQLDIVCIKCNCSYESQYEEQNISGYECPNCGMLNES
jgi:hypothetical protein